MEKAKGILTTVGVIALVLTWWGWDAHSDYTWSGLIIKQKAKEGWIVGATQDNVVDITHPWTIFRRPIVRVAFVKPSEFIRLDDGKVLAEVLWVDYRDMARTEEESFWNLFDCRNNKTAFVEGGTSLAAIDVSRLKWRDNVGSSSEDIANEVCRGMLLD